jgi:hypothetical protein
MFSPRLVAVGLLLWGAASLADPYDLRVYKLGNPTQGAATYDPGANGRFAAFARSLAAGLTSVDLAPPESLGHSAFAVTAELSMVQFQQSGLAIPTQRLNDQTPGVDGSLLLPSIHVRKGLPWSFEVGARFAWIEKSSMAAATGEVKWALNEGLLYLPDLGLRGYATRLLNSEDFSLTATGLDLGIGKKFAIGGMLTLSPYAGWNLVWVGASSNTIDFNRGGSDVALAQTTQDQFRNTGVYDALKLGANSHNRFYGGLRFITGALQLGAEYSTSRIPSIDGKPVPPVNAYNFTLGLDF